MLNKNKNTSSEISTMSKSTNYKSFKLSKSKKKVFKINLPKLRFFVSRNSCIKKISSQSRRLLCDRPSKSSIENYFTKNVRNIKPKQNNYIANGSSTRKICYQKLHNLPLNITKGRRISKELDMVELKKWDESSSREMYFENFIDISVEKR